MCVFKHSSHSYFQIITLYNAAVQNSDAHNTSLSEKRKYVKYDPIF